MAQSNDKNKITRVPTKDSGQGNSQRGKREIAQDGWTGVKNKQDVTNTRPAPASPYKTGGNPKDD